MKQQQRTLLKARRKALTREFVQTSSAMIVKKLKPYLKGTCALYKAYGNEVCLDALFDVCDYVLPVVDNDCDMHFVYPDDSGYHSGAFQIQEPNSSRICPKADIDVMVVPLVGFDENNHRLGHGKGYYDRYLEGMDVLVIGVAFEMQKLKNVSVEAHDRDCDLIITEQKIYQKA